MRGRKVEVGDSSCILFVRHKKTCKEYGNNSPVAECECIKNVQFRDGSRRSTSEWKWSKAEDVAQRMLQERLGLGEISAATPEGYSVEKAIDEWIEEREQGGIKNLKAKRLTKKLLAWCHRNNIMHLNQIQKHALKLWRTREWRYRNGDSASMKVHWGILRNFFEWCMDGDLLELNPCPKLKGTITEKEVIPFTPEQIELLLQTAMTMPKWDVAQRVKMRTFISLMQWSGMAIGDAACLERSRVVGLVISGKRRKRRKTKNRFSVPVPQHVVDALHMLPCNQPQYFFWHRSAYGSVVMEDSIVTKFGQWFRMIADAAGMPEGHSHMLRHSFATYHLGRGVPIERVAEWMGDTPAQVRRTYEHWLPQRDAQSLRAMQDSWARMGLDEAGNPLEVATVAVN